MEPNFQVGQYILEKPLGEGGMAEVWLGRNLHVNVPVAIKFLNRAYAGMSEVEQRFLNEGRRQGSLNHPNIIKVYGFEYVDSHSFLILQYVDGESLETLLERSGFLQPAEASRIAISVLNGLDHAHEHNMVHRDIKPSNILIDGNGITYIGDFGIALASNEKRITRTGTSMGTALYMSPEQITKPSSVDRRSDIYSFGCVLCEMLTGQPPFNPRGGDGDTDFAIKTAHVQQPPPALRERKPDLSPELEAVVLRCLAKKPDDRYATCREVRDALSAAIVSRSRRPETVIETPPPKQPVRTGDAQPPEKVQPAPVSADLANRIHQAQAWATIGLVAMILSCVLALIAAVAVPFAALLAVVASHLGLVYGIMAIVHGKRTRSNSDPALRRIAASAEAQGRIDVFLYAVPWIVFAFARGLR